MYYRCRYRRVHHTNCKDTLRRGNHNVWVFHNTCDRGASGKGRGGLKIEEKSVGQEQEKRDMWGTKMRASDCNRIEGDDP